MSKPNGRDHAVYIVLALGALVTAGGGAVTSFSAVTEELRKDFGELAFLGPLSVDLGILVSSAAYVILSRRREAHPMLRWLPHALTAATVYLNVSAGETVVGSIAHGVLVALWAVGIEAAAYVARARLLAETADVRDPIPLARWLVDPVRTVVLWRRMILWGVTSYRLGAAYERAYRYASGHVETRYRNARAVPPVLRYELKTCEWPDEVGTALEDSVRYGGPWKPAVLEWLDSYLPAVPVPVAEEVPVPPVPPVPDDREEVPVPVPVRAEEVPVPAAGTGTEGAVPSRRLASVPAVPVRAEEEVPVPAEAEDDVPAVPVREPVDVPAVPVRQRRGTRTEDELLEAVRAADAAHRAATGRPIAGQALAAAIGVNKTKALLLLKTYRAA